MSEEKADSKVSPNNPCPFLRALVQQDLLNDEVASSSDIAANISKVANTGEGSPAMPSFGVRVIAVIANSLNPLSIIKSAIKGVRLNTLRNGPLDKKGSGSRILDAQGVVNEAELERLAQFASDKQASDGTSEIGLDAKDLTQFMDANFARAEGNRRRIDRKLMNGEWPVILKVFGKDGTHGRYVSVDDVRRLFVERKFPERMTQKL